jgi:hypothetical protein
MIKEGIQLAQNYQEKKKTQVMMKTRYQTHSLKR